MKTQRIYSKNAIYQKFDVLRRNRNKRYKYNEFFVEGVRNINQAIANQWHISSFLYTKERPLSDWANETLKTVHTDINYELTAELMIDLSDKSDTSELIAIVKMREDNFQQICLSKNPFLVLFDRPSNKGNLGTIIRSCDAFGADGLIITGHAVDLYDPDVIVSSMGSFFKTPVIRISDNTKLEKFIQDIRLQYHDFKIVGTTAHKQHSIYDVDLTTPLMLMIGNETEGLCRAYKEQCDVLATIPMSDKSSASSLNVACAATVMFYETMHQRCKTI